VVTALEVDIQGAAGPLSIEIAFRASDAPVIIVGPNGAGKTSALMMMLGATRPHRGRVALDGTPVFDHEQGIDVAIERRRIGFLPQKYALFPHLDVLRNVAYGIRAPSPAERARLAMAALHDLDASALARRRPSELSGGEAQRVALARALAHRPRALLLDEPLGALDVSVRREVRRFLADHLRAWGLPTVVVTHDRADTEALGGELLVMESGSIVQKGRLGDLAARPQTEFVRQFVSGYGA
jgi:molybdate transport system ATP-binding protein